MPGIEISALPAASSAQLTDVFPIDQLPGPVTYKLSLDQVLTLFGSYVATSIEGTQNQVLANGSYNVQETGAVKLTLPQDIATTSNTVFNSTTGGNLKLSSNSLTSINANGNINIVPNGTGQILAFGTTAFNTVHTISMQSLYSYSRARYNSGTPGNTASFLGFGSRAAGPGSWSALQVGDPVARTSAHGDDGSAWAEMGMIQFEVETAPTPGVIPSSFNIYTTNSLGARVLAVKVDKDQNTLLQNPLLVASGGTGKGTFTAYGLIAGGTTSTGNLQSLSTGTSGQLLQSNGAAALPSYTATPTVTSISFGSTALNFFEQSTFTPTVTAATVGDLSVSYTSQLGYYTRINTRVFYTILLTFTPTYTTASGAIRVAGLPYTASNSNFVISCNWGGTGFTNPAGAISLYGSAVSGQTYLSFGYARSANTNQTLNIASFTSGSSATLFINGSYLA